MNERLPIAERIGQANVEELRSIISKAFEVEHHYGGFVSWRILTIGYLIGRGQSPEDAVKTVKQVFDAQDIHS